MATRGSKTTAYGIAVQRPGHVMRFIMPDRCSTDHRFGWANVWKTEAGARRWAQANRAQTFDRYAPLDATNVFLVKLVIGRLGSVLDAVVSGQLRAPKEVDA